MTMAIGDLLGPGKSACRLAAVAICAVLAAAPSKASELSGNELEELLAGNTLYLSAPFGSLPITYSPTGSMVSRSMAMALFSGVYEDRGQWRIADNRLCQRWTLWNDGKEQCFAITRKDGKLHWRSDDGMTGTARPAE